MAYIIQLEYPAENRYFIRHGHGNISVWGSKPRGAARFETTDQAQTVINNQLKAFPCDIVEIE